MRTPSRRNLVGPLPIVLLIVGALGGLWTLHRGAGDLSLGGSASARDPLAVAYLEAELHRDPADARARLRLVHAQLTLGRIEEAERTMAPLLATGLPLTAEQASTLLDLSRAAWRGATPGTQERADAERRGLERLERLLAGDVSAQMLRRVAEDARELGRPRIAAQALERLARVEPRSCRECLIAAARDYLAAEAPDLAAGRLEQAQACATDDRDALALGLQAVDAYLAAGQADAALRVSEDLVRRFPVDPDLLRTAQGLALGQGDVLRARRYGGELIALGATDPKLFQRQIDLGMAAGDPGGAFDAAERLARLRPNDAGSHLAAARLAAWADRPGQALYHWLWLARSSKVPGASDQALNLARALGNDKALVTLIEQKGEQGPLAPATLRELEGALSNVEGPSRATDALQAHALRFPDNRAAWEELATGRERQRDLEGALDTLKQIDRRFGATLQSAMRIATMEWRLGRPAEALRGLEGWKSSAGHDVAYWTMVGELAWELEADALALQAYGHLWELGQGDAGAAERLLVLTRASGQPDQVIRLGVEGWSRMKEPRLLLIAMDEAASAGRWDRLRQLAEMAMGSEAAFSRQPSYWLLIARLEEHDGQTAAATASYEQALLLDPGSRAARTGLIWLLAGSHDRKRLAEVLAAWTNDGWNDPQMRRAYAAALEELGYSREALAFYQKDASTNAGDDGSVRRYAMALDRAGDRRTAGDLQRYLDDRTGSGSEPAKRAELPVVLVTGSDAAPSLEAVVRAEQQGFHIASVRADAGGEIFGPLVIQRVGAAIDATALGATFGISGGGTQLTWSDPPQPNSPTQQGDIVARANFAALGGRNDVAMGGNFQGASSLFMGTASHEHTIAGTTSGRVDGFLNQPADESAGMRLLAVRSGVGGAVSGSTEGFYGRGAASWKSWSTRTGGAIGTGVLTSAEVGYRIPRTYPDLRVRVQGSAQWNKLAPGVEEQGFSALAVGPSGILPEQLTMIGFGISAARYDVGPVRLSGDLWLGGMGPAIRPAYRAQLGVSMNPYRDGEMSLIGFAGNDNWSSGGTYGLGLSLTHGFAQ